MRHGRHVKVVGKGASAMLGSANVVSAFLESVVRAVGMTALAPPVTYDVEVQVEKLGREPFEDEGGVTGIVVLSTSHCAIHTWPARHLFIMDLFSCRDFDPTVVLEQLRQHFGTFSVRMTDVSESLDYDDS